MIAMEPGTHLDVPVEAYCYTTVRGYASDLSFVYMRRYTVERRRAERIYHVTREQ